MLVPVEAYRDEGVSYHYAKPTDYLVVETAQRLIEILEEIHIPYNTTKTWTTDAFYRETEWNVLQSCQSVNFEKKKFINFYMRQIV